MNLAQLIDPEWVQQGKPDRFPQRRRSSGTPALQVRTHTKDLDEVELLRARPDRSGGVE